MPLFVLWTLGTGRWFARQAATVAPQPRGGFFLFVHLLGVVAWLGPIFGAWHVYRQARHTGDQNLIIWTPRQL